MKMLPPGIARLADQPGPTQILLRGLVLLLTLAIGVIAGRYWAYHETATLDTKKGLRQELAVRDEALRAVRGELEMQRTRHEVDQHALELLRTEMAAEKERTADLEEGLSFYRSMVASEDMTKGISLRKPELVPGSSPGRVRYRFFAQQKERDYEMVEGSLSVEVFGVSGDREQSYPLGELSSEFDSKAATLHFRYFQAIEGELTLPEGFAPQGLKLVIRASKPSSTEVREQFPWELQERLINVGK
jgi:hypothetical protein